MSEDQKPVYEVTEVTVNILESMPPTLVVNASGNTRTGGWTNAGLARRVYIDPPADGIQDYDFVATPPDGGSTDAITEIKAAPDSWHDPSAWVRGVRVHAETNKLEKQAPIKTSAA